SGAGVGGKDSGRAGTGGGGAAGADGVEAIDLGGDLGQPDALAKWTVFVYGHADHNLSNSFVRDLVEMARAELDENVQVIVLADFDASQELADSGELFPTGAEWLRIPGGGREPESLGVEDELDFDDPAVLAGAVATAFAQFPAEHRALILWDHGGSWSGGFGGDSQDGTRAQPTPMSPSELRSAVAAGVRAAKLTAEPALDIFSFDTCLMAGTEVAWELHELASVYIANAEIDYGDGWDYERFLTHLAQHPDDGAREIALAEVELWDAHHSAASFNDVLLRSHVALDTAALPALADAVGELVRVWQASSSLNAVELGRAAYFSLPPYMNQIENPQASPELRDLGQFLRAMSAVADDAVASAAASARVALDEAILGRSQGDLREAAQQLGVHVELPLAARVDRELFAAYDVRAAAWSEASGWGAALREYSAADDSVAPVLTAAILNGQNPDATHLPTVEFEVPSPDVAEVNVELAVLDDPGAPSKLVFFGIVGRSAIEPSTTYDFSWNGQLTALPDGKGGQQAIYVSLWEDGGSDSSTSPPVLASFGLLETSDGASALGALLFQDGDEETALLTLLDPPVTLPLAEIVRDLPGSAFTPLLVSLDLATDEQTFVAGATFPIDSATIPISQGPAAAGSYALVTSAYDVFGNIASDLQITDVTTPIEQ
ncbi:MAG TPA: clostripain-related cysteine peptidase, partial [Polyangiales bacterium]|nr:clostripain-related cysteine peptidase [Polyangiales bacterium]